MISLYDKDSKKEIGTITKPDLKFLRDQLEEEGVDDQDYAITTMLLDLWEAEGKKPSLVKMLRKAIGKRKEMNIEWNES